MPLSVDAWLHLITVGSIFSLSVWRLSSDLQTPHVCVHVRTCLHAHLHVYMCTCVHVYMCTCVHVCTCVHMFAHVCTLCTCVHICAHVCTCVHMCSYMRTGVQVYTRTCVHLALFHGYVSRCAQVLSSSRFVCSEMSAWRKGMDSRAWSF